MEELTKLLLRYQRKHNLSDSALADLLSISASLISYLRSDHRGLGINTVRIIWQKIPELRNECLKWTFPDMDLATLKQLEDLRAMR